MQGVKLEFVPKFTEISYKNKKRKWKVEAIHVTVTGNKREYTEEELRLAGRSFSFRPLNINHSDHWLEYNWKDPTAEGSSTSLYMNFDQKLGIHGSFEIDDSATYKGESVNDLVASGRINKLSIEQSPELGESCGCKSPDNCSCKQNGVHGMAIALLESTVEPGDPKTKIAAESVDKKGEPFAGYTDFADCVSKNQDKEDPEGYCGSIKRDTEVISSVKPDPHFQDKMSSTTDVKTEDKKEEAKPPGVLDNKVVPLSPAQMENIKSPEQKQIEALEKELGVHKTEIEKLIERFTPKDKIDTAKAISAAMIEQSSQVAKKESVVTRNAESYNKAIAWLKEGTPSHSIKFKLDTEEYLRSVGYVMNDEGKPIGRKVEALTSATQMIDYNTAPIVIPGAQVPHPIRQYVNFSRITQADRAAWYTSGVLTFGAVTEGSAPSEDSLTLAQVTAVPSTRGSFLKVKYSQIEDNPFPLVDHLNMLAMRAAIDAEAKEILDTIADATTPATNQWKNGNTGAVITDDDQIGASATLTLTGVSKAKLELDKQGYASQGPYVLAVHPQPYNELVISSGISTFVQQGIPEITRTGLLASLLGVRIEQYDQVTAKDNTSFDTFRNSLFVPNQAFGLAAAREFTIKAEEHSELQQLFWIATHRIAGKILDNAARVRISTSQ